MFSLLTPLDINGLTIGGIDGGYVSRLLIGFDFLFFRSIAVFSSYSARGIKKTTYYPSKTPPLEVAVSDVGLSSMDFENMASIRRTISELQMATQILNYHTKKIDILLLDGSPVLKKPITKNQKIQHYYQTYISILFRLISQSQTSGVKLAWIVKDSRLNMFSKFLGKMMPFLIDEIPEFYSLDYRSIINRSRDMDILFYLLKPSTRSMVYRHNFPFPEEFAKEFSLYLYYLKTAPYDIPLRIELFQPSWRDQESLIEETNVISETILPLSQYNRKYGIPAPIVEADARARIKDVEVDSLFQLMRNRHPSPDLWIRRRERTPWKF
jgi:hypothetical protein